MTILGIDEEKSWTSVYKCSGFLYENFTQVVLSVFLSHDILHVALLLTEVILHHFVLSILITGKHKKHMAWICHN